MSSSGHLHEICAIRQCCLLGVDYPRFLRVILQKFYGYCRCREAGSQKPQVCCYVITLSHLPLFLYLHREKSHL